MSAVAAEAGVDRKRVYARFGDRAGLLAALAAAGLDVPADDPRARILDAVGVVLERRGLAGVTLDEVAREAGVGAVTVYRRFTDRRGLLRAFIAERTPRRLAATLPLDGSDDPDAGLLLLARESMAFLRAHRQLFLARFAADEEARALSTPEPGAPPTVRELTAAYVQAHFPDPTGRTVHAFFGLLMSLAWSGEGDVEADAAFVVRCFLDGVRR